MPTIKRRLLVTLQPELDDVLRRLGKAKGVPQARIASQLLMAGLPGLVEVARHLESAQKVDGAMLASLAAFGHSEIVSATQRALLLVAVDGRKRKRKAR